MNVMTSHTHLIDRTHPIQSAAFTWTLRDPKAALKSKSLNLPPSDRCGGGIVVALIHSAILIRVLVDLGVVDCCAVGLLVALAADLHRVSAEDVALECKDLAILDPGWMAGSLFVRAQKLAARDIVFLIDSAVVVGVLVDLGVVDCYAVGLLIALVACLQSVAAE